MTETHIPHAVPMISWLHQQGLRGASGATVLEGLCDLLLNNGVQVDRAVVGYLVFHPQFDGMNFTWVRDTKRAERQAVTVTDILRLPSPFLHMQSTGMQEMRYRLNYPEAALPYPFLDRLRHDGFTDYLAFFQPFGSSVDGSLWPELPAGLSMQEGVTGSFSTTSVDGFNEHQITLLRTLFPPLAVAVKVSAVLEMAETLLGAYLGTASGRNVLRGQVRRGQGQVIHAVVWHSDLRDSTSLAETAPLETYLSTLNSYYDCVVNAIVEQGGDVLKFIGDGVLAMFPFEAGSQFGAEAACRAIAAARAALHALAMVNVERVKLGRSAIHCGIVLHAGDVMYGNVGSAQRLDFTVMGPAISEVVRLETLCKKLHVPLVVSEVVAPLPKEPLRSLGTHTLEGVGRAIEVFSLPELIPQ